MIRQLAVSVLLSASFCLPCAAQIVASPTCSFEQLTWGDSPQSVRQKLIGKTLVGSDTINPSALNKSDLWSYSYDDTVDLKQVGLSLGFSDGGRRLSIITLFYFGTSNGTAKASTGVVEGTEELWRWFTTRYGPRAHRSRFIILGAGALLELLGDRHSDDQTPRRYTDAHHHIYPPGNQIRGGWVNTAFPVQAHS